MEGRIEILIRVDPEEIIAEEKQKKTCFKYLKGHCDYHPVCLFSHLTPEREAELQKQIEERKRKQNAKRKAIEGGTQHQKKEPTLDDWLTKRMKTHAKSEGVTAQPDTANPSQSGEETLYTLPLELQGIPNLPPSLIPPSAKDLTECSNLQWGIR
ncbi:zinc finger matrin-type protein 5-like isoform X2 [Amphiura filiformis]|uniref:zinc finger matrin-type protein 5-like isoform X2 n=1 Tax=Amphiura filiformis TaxID=82378 RepID=UPI003B20EF4A